MTSLVDFCWKCEKIFVHYLRIIDSYRLKRRTFIIWLQKWLVSRQLDCIKIFFWHTTLFCQKNVFKVFPFKISSKHVIKPFFTFAVRLYFRISLIDSNAVVKRIVLLCLNIRLDNCYENIVARISQNVYLQRTSLSAFDRTSGSSYSVHHILL